MGNDTPRTNPDPMSAGAKGWRTATSTATLLRAVEARGGTFGVFYASRDERNWSGVPSIMNGVRQMARSGFPASSSSVVLKSHYRPARKPTISDWDAFRATPRVGSLCGTGMVLTNDATMSGAEAPMFTASVAITIRVPYTDASKPPQMSMIAVITQ
jgi:hypothetical protein